MAKKNNYFKAFCNVSKAFGTTLSKDKILDLIVENAIETMDGKAACLFLADEESDVFIPVAQKGLSDNYLHASPIHAQKITESILKEGYLAFRDACNDPQLENHEAKRAEGIVSILDVPVMVRDRLIGVLALYTSEPRDFTRDEVDFLSALADQGGMAIQQARLFERVNSNAQLFLDLVSSINSSLDIKQILHILSADTSEALGMKGVSIRLFNPETKTMDLVASYGLSEEFLGKCLVDPDKSRFVASALRGETIIIEDVPNDERLSYREEAKKEGVASMLCVPIKSRDDVIGVMRIFSGVKREFPKDIVTLAQAIAHQGALAIQNASSYLRLEKDKKDLEEEIWSHRSWF